MNPCFYQLTLTIDTFLRKEWWLPFFSLLLTLPIANAQDVTCPPEVTISCEANQDPYSNPDLGIPTVNIPCELVTFTFQDVIIPGPCTGTYTIERNWDGSGDCDSPLECTQIINVVDDTPPSVFAITIPPPRLQCGDLGNPQDLLFWADMTVTTANTMDNCSSVSASHDFTLDRLPDVYYPNCGTNNAVGYYVVTYTYSDDCGNTGSHFQNVFIYDDLAPVIADVPDLVLDCTDPALEQKVQSWLNNVTGDDWCRGTLPTTNDYDPANYDTERGCGEYQFVTFTATDNCGHSVEKRGYINLVDNTPPVLTHPQPHLILSCNDPNKDQLIDNWLNAIQVTEDCSELDGLEYVYNPEGFSNPCGRVGDQEVLFTAFNACASESRITAMITLLPENPVIICHNDQFINCRADIVVPQNPVDWIQACGPEGEPIYSGPVLVSGNPDCDGAIYEVRRSVTDDCGAEGVCIERYIIRGLAPQVICPEGSVVACREDIVVSPSDVQYLTSCGVGASVSIVGPSRNGRADCPGTVYTYRYLVTDACGRTGFCDRTFTIANPAPTMSVAPDQTVECLEDIQVSAADVVVNVSCGNDYELSISEPLQQGPSHCPGTTYRYTYTLEDACGRSVSADRIFTLDNGGPQIIEAEDLTVYCVDDIQVSTTDIKVLSACGQDYLVTLKEPELHPEYSCTSITLEYLYTVIDACGRMAQDIRYITVEHRVPFIETPEPLYVDCLDENELLGNFPFAFSYCGELEYRLDISEPRPYLKDENACTYAQYTVIYSVIDDCGVMICVTQQVYAEEEWLEFSELPKDTTIACGTILPVPDIEARGACGENLLVEYKEKEVIDEDSGELYLLRNWKTESACGREWKHQQEIRFDCNDAPGFSVNDRNHSSTKRNSRGTGRLRLYPNPAVERLFVEYHLESIEESKAILSIYNLRGRRVRAETVDVTTGFNQVEMNIIDLPTGTYTLIIEVDNESKKSERFVKLKTN